MIDTERLADVFRRYPGILAVYLFGSHALGRARPDSEVDLVILDTDDSVSGFTRAENTIENEARLDYPMPGRS